jgi:propanediol dehydratase large subunit
MANVLSGSSTKTEAEWAEDVKRLLRAEMTRRGVTYEDLAERLAAIGVNDTAVNLRNKVARGRFSSVFLVQCLAAMSARSLRIGENHDAQ